MCRFTPPHSRERRGHGELRMGGKWPLRIERDVREKRE